MRLGTKRRTGGPLSGLECCLWVLFTAVLIPHWTDATTHELVKIGWGLPSTSGGLNCLERASGFGFLESGWYERVKLKWLKEGSTSLAWVQSLGLLDVGEVPVVCPDEEWVLGTLQPMSPLHKYQLYLQQLPVTNCHNSSRLGKVDVKSKHKGWSLLSLLTLRQDPTLTSKASTSTTKNRESEWVR